MYITIIYLHTYFESVESKPHLNQISFQKVVFELSANGKVLPMDKFSPGNLYFETLSNEDRNSVVMVHNNHIKGKAKKIQRFEYFQLWTLNEGNVCQFDPTNHILFKYAISDHQCTVRSQIQELLQAAFCKPFKKFKMPQLDNIEYIGKRNLEKAKMRGLTDFKTNVREYYYFATKHWKT